MTKVRDRRFGVDREERRKNRADIVVCALDNDRRVMGRTLAPQTLLC
jgi:hypothetical protein